MRVRDVGVRMKYEYEYEEYEEYDLDFDFDYLEFPVLFRYNLNTGTFSPYFMPGLKLSILTDCSVSILSYEDEEISITCNGFDVNKLDIGFHAGAGIDINLIPSVMFTLDVAYNYGLSSVFKDSEDSSFLEDGQGKNRAFSILAGVTVPIGR